MIFFTPWAAIDLQRVSVEVRFVGVILQRLFHRLAHGLQAGKVHDAVDGVSLKDAVQSGLIPDVRLVIGQGPFR